MPLHNREQGLHLNVQRALFGHPRAPQVTLIHLEPHPASPFAHDTLMNARQFDVIDGGIEPKTFHHGRLWFDGNDRPVFPHFIRHSQAPVPTIRPHIHKDKVIDSHPQHKLHFLNFKRVRPPQQPRLRYIAKPSQSPPQATPFYIHQAVLSFTQLFLTPVKSPEYSASNVSTFISPVHDTVHALHNP